MILTPAFFIGAIVGWLRAGKRGGNRLDKIQYAVAHGLAVMLITLIALLAAGWLGLTA